MLVLEQDSANVGSAMGYDDAALDSLTWHWGGAYLISHPAPDTWLAVRRDDRETLRAGMPGELLDRIRSDYLRCPVSVRVQRPELSGGARSGRGRFMPEG
jgi:hypothetical protein